MNLRSAATAAVVAFGASLALGILLLVAFDPDVQTIDADELVARSDDARRFLVADYVFIALYAVASPIAQWRFRGALGSERPAWMSYAPWLLLAAGLVDATENTLLVTATRSENEGTVDAAHALAVPKVVLFLAGLLLAIGVLIRAVRVLRDVR